MEGLCLRGRHLRLELGDDDGRGTIGRTGGRLQQRSGRRGDVQLTPGAGGHHPDLTIAPDGEVGIAGGPGEAVRQVLEVARRDLLPDTKARRPVGRKLQELNHLARLDREDGALVHELHGRGENGAKLPGHRRERGARNLGRINGDRKRGLLLAIESSERRHHDARSRIAVERLPGLGRHDLGLEAVEDE
jgi:hypothetical protein